MIKDRRCPLWGRDLLLQMPGVGFKGSRVLGVRVWGLGFRVWGLGLGV